MVKFGLRKLLKPSLRDGADDAASSKISDDDAVDADEKRKTRTTSSTNVDKETDERQQLFGANRESKKDTNESDSAKGGEDAEGEEDLHKMLEDMEIPDFSLSMSVDYDDDLDSTETSNQKTNDDNGNIGVDTVDYEDRLEREEVFSNRYHPSKSENKELQDVAERLGVSSSSIRLTKCQTTLHELFFGNHSIILKKGPISFNDQDCELFLLSDGFVSVYQNVNIFNPLESRYDTCQFWSDVEFVDVANFGTINIQMRSGDLFEIRCGSGGEDSKSWLKAIEHVAIHNTIHDVNSSTITDIFGWQYKLIRQPAYTAAVNGEIKSMGNPKNLNQLDEYNQSSPLHYAIQYEPCSADIVDALLRVGADPNLSDGEGRSAMYYAQRNNLSDIEKILKEHGGRKSQLAEIELKGELFGGVDQAKRNTTRRREIEQAVKDNKAAEAAAKTQSVQSQMNQNMAAMIERGEKINAMDDKALQLNDEAKNYGKLATQLKNQMKNKKWYQF